MFPLHKGIVVWESSYWNVLDTLKGIGPFKMSDWQATSHKYNFIHKAKSQNPAAAFPQPFSDAHLAAPHSGRLALRPPTLPRCIGLSSLITGPVTNQGHWRRLIPPVPTTYLVHSFFIRTATHTLLPFLLSIVISWQMLVEFIHAVVTYEITSVVTDEDRTEKKCYWMEFLGKCHLTKLWH